MRNIYRLGIWVAFLMTTLFSVTQPTLGQQSMPRPQYPRPDFQREAWLNLNGTWNFQFDPANEGEAAGWFETSTTALQDQIAVPFPWQSELSGVRNTSYRGVAWYNRTFTVPEGWSGQVVLHFGAVDYLSRVWVNGSVQGENEGGYNPFEFDITAALQPGENTITVRVDDPADQREIPHGKQRSLPPNPWDDVSFTTTSGIWQTVWLENRPADYIVSAQITPDVPGEQAEIAVRLHTRHAAVLQVEATGPDGRSIAQQLDVSPADEVQTLSLTLPIDNPVLWDIGQPNLYDVSVKLITDEATDTVNTYFGMRSIERQGRNVLLNGRPIYLMSALDQGYWPDGLYTAPTD